MKKSILFLLCVFLAKNALAQVPCNLRLQGYLRFSDDSSAVENAELFVENTHVKSGTSIQGYFQLKKICRGQVLLEIDLGDNIHIHYFLYQFTDSFIELYIQRPHTALSAAKITGKKTSTGINNEQLLQNAGDGLASQLQQLQGVQLLRTGNSIAKPVAEGMSGLRLPIYVNGVKQEGQQWGQEHGPEIDILGYQNVNILNGVRVLTRSHDAMGGIVEILGNKQAHSGETDITVGSAYALNGNQLTELLRAMGNPFGKPYTWYSNSSFRRSGNYNAPDYYLRNTGLLEFGTNAGFIVSKNEIKTSVDASWYHNKSGIFSGSSIGNIDDLQKAIQRREPLYGAGEFSYAISRPHQSVDHTQLRYQREKPNSNFIAAWQFDNRREYDFHRSTANKLPQLDLYQNNVSVYSDYNTSFLKHKYLQWGWSSSQSLNRYAGYFFIPDFVANSSGIYGLAQIKKRNYHLLFSARGDGKFLFASWTENTIKKTDSRYFGNLSAGIEITRYGKRNRTVLNIMRLWRSPWVNELYSKGVHHGSAAYELGNSLLKNEHDYKAQIEFFFENKWLLIYNKSYFHYINNYINLSPGETPILTVRGAFPLYYYKQFDAIFTGSDMSVSLKFGKKTEWQNKGSFIYGRDITNRVYPAFLPLPYFQSTLRYAHKNLTVFANYQYTWKHPFYTDSSDYLPPPDSYFLLHFGVHFKNLFHGQHINVYFEANNLLNTAYRNYLDRFRYFADLPGRNIQLRIIYNFHHHNEKS